jgi:uncharacterized repeat protein (TIGR03803 family)
MVQMRNCLTNGLVAGALASAALLHMPTAQAAATERVVYSFCSQPSCTDGAIPVGALTSVNHILYGTTEDGGTGTCSSGCGTVFSLDPATGTETVLYSFQGSSHKDGSAPAAGLIRIGGLLYGTTAGGGTGACTSGCGTVFALNPARGADRILHSFQENSRDGMNPLAALTSVGGTLYGTTRFGGRGTCAGTITGCGTVFSLDPTTGAYRVLHSFEPDRGGAYPLASDKLINVNGTLYGTTLEGGAGTCSSSGQPGCGAVFGIDPTTGAERAVYSFPANGSHGVFPRAGLISVNGTLYGTTSEGGTTGCGSAGCGTVFSFNTTTGIETVVHSFPANGLGGFDPVSSLISVDGTLYGTTPGGGTGACPSGCGTVFAIDPTTGAERVLHSFQNDGADGYYPNGGVIDILGTLYGTTYQGGAHGQGTVFAIAHWQ